MAPPTLIALEGVFGAIVSAAIGLLGLAFLAMLLVGGFQYLSSSGDKETTQKAQKTLTYAIGGLILAVSAWVILNLLGNFFGINLSLFSLCLTGSILPCN